MAFSRLPLRTVIEFSRSTRHLLESGLTLGRAMRMQAKRGPLAIRPVAGRLADRLERGDSFEEALKSEDLRFPPLFLSLASVAEETGRLPEVLREVEDYFSTIIQLRMMFLARIAWPAFCLTFGIGVIAFVLVILGWIAEMHGTKPLDILGFGLTGTQGALLFLCGVAVFFTALVGLYLGVRKLLRAGPLIDDMLLSTPVLGPCLRSLSLARFSLGLYITTETGMPLADAVRLSLHATGNSAFYSRSPQIEERVRAGDDLAETLGQTPLFPQEYIAIVENAEVTGQVPEVMRKQAEHYQEDGVRRLKIMTWVAAISVYFSVAGLIIWTIFRIYGRLGAELGKTLDGLGM